VQKLELLVRVGGDDGVGVLLLIRPLILAAIPETSHTKQLVIFPLDVVRYLLLAVVLFQPLVEALCDNDTTLTLLHSRPHPAVLDKGVVAAIDRLHHGAVVGASLCPKGNESCMYCQQYSP